MRFPTMGDGRPYVRIDGRTGMFALSEPEGGPSPFDMKGRRLALDLGGAKQGWLRVDQSGVDWVELNAPDEWQNPPAPSQDHRPGVVLDVMCEDWPDPKVRELRGNSRAVTGLVAAISEKAELVKGKAVLIRLKAAHLRKVGRGTSVEFDFDVAPAGRWPDLSAFDAHRDAPEADGADGADADADAWA